MNLFTKQKETHRLRKWTYGCHGEGIVRDSGREGKGGKIWENGIETCKISCMKRVASPGSMHDTGCLGLMH